MTYIQVEKININKIKSQMALHELTYESFAEILGCKKATLHSKLVGRRRFNQEELDTMADYFGVSLDYFFNE